MPTRPPLRYTSGMIPSLFTLFVAGIVFFVDNNQADVFCRHKYGGTGSDHNISPARAHTPPVIKAFPLCQAAVLAKYFFRSEACRKSTDQLIR